MSERGFILLGVLWIAAAISVMALGYAAESRLLAVEARNLRELHRDSFVLESALALAQHELAKYKANQPVIMHMRTKLAQLGDEELPEDWPPVWYPRSEPYETTIDGQRVAVTLRSEMGRMDVNDTPKDRWLKVLGACGIEDPQKKEELYAAFKDWTDPDESVFVGGAEQDYYDSLDTPYLCKNKPIETMDEFLLIKGFDRDIVYGEGGGAGLVDFFTIYRLDAEAKIKASQKTLNPTEREEIEESTLKMDLNSAAPEALVLVTDTTDNPKFANALARAPFERLPATSELTDSTFTGGVGNYFFLADPEYIRIEAALLDEDGDRGRSAWRIIKYEDER